MMKVVFFFCNAISFIVIVNVIVACVFTAIITIDLVINVNDTGAVPTTISVDFVSLNFVIAVIVFDVVAVFVIDVIADIIFIIEVIVVITFVFVDFTTIIIDIHVLVVVDVTNVIDVVVIIFIVVVNTSFVRNEMSVDTDIAISIYSTTFFLFACCQRLLLFLFLDRSFYSFGDL